jgi:hypothetical protein
MERRIRGEQSYWQSLTVRLIASHLAGHDRIHGVNRRKSEMALVRFDIDAHKGQADAEDAGQWLHDRYFRDAYGERTNHGVALYVLIDVRGCRREKFNAILADARDVLAAKLQKKGIRSTLEIHGGYTLIDWNTRTVMERAHLAALPRLPRGEADWQRLRDMPTMPLSRLERFARRKRETKSKPSKPSRPEPEPADTADAFKRMQEAGYELQRQLRRPPDVAELVTFYEQRYAGVATVDDGTYRRAADVVRYLEKTWDDSRQTEIGYAACRERLLSVVQQHCTDRRTRSGRRVSDEFLAVQLYAIQWVSFCMNDSPRRQWTAPNNYIEAMFRALANAGLHGIGS